MSKYKNVYTILEKVKKGQIKSHYGDQNGLFGKLNFYKKSDLITPYIHYIDQDKIDNIVRDYIFQDINLKGEFDYLQKTPGFKKLADDQKPNLTAFAKKVRENYRNIPDHLKYDIFKLYYHKMDKLEFEERTESNKTRYKFLEQANNPVGKIMTEGSNLKSAIFTRNTIMHYLLKMTEMDYVDPDASEQIRQSLKGSNEFDDQSQNMDKMFNSDQSKNMMERLMKDAQEICKSMDDAMDQEVQQELFDQADKSYGNDNTASKMNVDFIKTIAAKVNRININLGSMKEKIKKLLDKSVSYFSSKKTTTYEDLFNSDNIGGLEDYVLLHPRLRKIFAEDLTVKDTKSIGKIDIYIDISGSMCSDSGLKDPEGKSLSKMDFAKALAVKMKELDLLNDVYLFDNRVKKWKSDVISISMIDGHGGTSIDSVIASVENKESNAIVLTDAEDRCSRYSEKVFFIGVQGADFRHFNDDVIHNYSSNGQVIVFDGSRTYKVDSSGKTVK